MESKAKVIFASVLVSCLTTLQSFTAWAEDFDEMDEFGFEKIERPRGSGSVLATPTLLMAPQRGSLVDLNYSYSSIEMKIKERVEHKINQSGHSGGISAAFALNPYFFFGVEADYTSSESSLENVSQRSTTYRKGEAEPELFVGGRMNSGPISTVFGLSYKMDIGESQTRLVQLGKEETDNKSGGSSFMPSVTIFSNQRNSPLFGGRVQYTVKQDRAELYQNDLNKTSESRTISGGNEAAVSAFFETPARQHSLGCVLTYLRMEEEETKNAFKKESAPETQAILLTGYGNIQASRMLSIQPALGYWRYLNDEVRGLTLSEQNLLLATIRARLAF